MPKKSIVKSRSRCPPGKVRNPSTGRCINKSAKKKQCPPGKVRNPSTGRCVTSPTSPTSRKSMKKSRKSSKKSRKVRIGLKLSMKIFRMILDDNDELRKIVKKKVKPIYVFKKVIRSAAKHGDITEEEAEELISIAKKEIKNAKEKKREKREKREKDK